MVSSDVRKKRFNIKWEDPVSFDNIHTYQLIVKSRSLDYLASHQDALRNGKVVRLRLDGTTKQQWKRNRYEVPSIGFSCSKNEHTYLRFDGVIQDEDGIDLRKVLSEIKKLNPTTLYVLELDIRTDTKMLLRFACKQMKMKAVTERIDQSMNTKETPLVLRYIYDIDTLKEIRVRHLGRKMSFVLIGEKGTKETTVYSIMED